jgi:hypothetical protein
MVDKRLSDGRRIAQLLASELTGDRGPLARIVVVDADPAAEPTVDGTRAYRVVRVANEGALAIDDRGETTIEAAEADTADLAAVFLQPDRARIEFAVAPETAAAAAERAGLRVRPKAVEPPRTLVFVEDGAEVKRAREVFRAVVAALEDDTARGAA